MKVNADFFEGMARSVPLNILAKHKNQIHQLEALLLGQAGLLQENFEEDYPKMLKKEYAFYKNKYGLRQCAGNAFFLRMRPGNFPTVRLAQLAMLVHESSHLFSKIKEATSVNEINKWFNVAANDYWHYHYRFDEVSAFKSLIRSFRWFLLMVIIMMKKNINAERCNGWRRFPPKTIRSQKDLRSWASKTKTVLIRRHSSNSRMSIVQRRGVLIVQSAMRS